VSSDVIDGPQEDSIKWHCHTRVDKYYGDSTNPEDLYDTVEVDGNLLMYGGASAFWTLVLGQTPSGYTAFGAAAIGVGDSSTAEAATQTDLQAATNKLRVACSPAPTHTDGTASTNNSQIFVATFTSAQANWAWNEWGVFSATSAGRMLNRKVESLGTKAVNSTWQLTVTLTIA
jgi:hypothetical protein